MLQALKQSATQWSFSKEHLTVQLTEKRTNPCEQAWASGRLADALLDSLTANVAVLDANGVIIAANTGWKQFAKNNQSSDRRYSIGADYLASCEAAVHLDHDHDQSARAALNGIRSVLCGDQDSFTLEYPWHASDEECWFRLRVTRLSLEQGVACLVSHEDITAKKQAEAALGKAERYLRESLEHDAAAQFHREELEAQLRQSQKLEVVGTLAGGIAHDFNNILAAILANTELASHDVNVSAAVQATLEEIDNAAMRGRELVKQILGFLRKRQSELAPVSLQGVMAEAVRLLRATLPARITIEVECEANVPEVAAERTQLMQVLLNLATNAMQAMPARSGTITLRLGTVQWVQRVFPPAVHGFAAAHPEGAVCMVVSDNGDGMDAATQARIFDPFFTTKPMGEGTGLGLSVVRGIVQSHGGVIQVDSRPGGGTTFSVYLPSAEMDRAVASSNAASRKSPPDTESAVSLSCSSAG